MASFATFIRRIQRRARQVEEGAGRKQRRAALAINQTVILATPVDTGRARANWQVAIGSPITEAIDDEDPAGVATISRNEGVIKGHRDKRDIILSNNVPYINELNKGSSSQAPAMFVELAVEQAIRAVGLERVFR